MPNRILRDWTDSAAVNALDFEAEVFFVRLIQKADDFGRFHANPLLLRSALFPLRDYSATQMLRMCAACEEQKLIRRYAHDGKDYLYIVKFRQTLRLMKSRFPDPDKCVSDAAQMRSGRGADAPPETNPNPNPNPNPNNTPDPPAPVVEPTKKNRSPKSTSILPEGFLRFWTAYPGHRRGGRAVCVLKWGRENCEPSADEIIRHVGACAKSRQWIDGIIPLAETYLNQRRWDNPPPPENIVASSEKPNPWILPPEEPKHES